MDEFDLNGMSDKEILKALGLQRHAGGEKLHDIDFSTWANAPETCKIAFRKFREQNPNGQPPKHKKPGDPIYTYYNAAIDALRELPLKKSKKITVTDINAVVRWLKRFT